MDPKVISKITRVHPEFGPKKPGKAVKASGPYWFGFWQENGITKRVYVGKELPEELKVLLSTRFKAPGHRQYSWPGRVQAA